MEVPSVTPSHDRLTAEQFDTLVGLMRGKPESPATKAARLVLVEGYKNHLAFKEVGSTASDVHLTVKRYLAAHAKVLEAYCGLR